MQFPHLSIVLEPIIVLLAVLIGLVALVGEEDSHQVVASAEVEAAEAVSSMIYISTYTSPIGDILLASNNNKLIGLWFKNQKYYMNSIKEETGEKNDEETLMKAKKWLDRYFKGEKPSIKELPLNPDGTEFRKKVWQILCEIPYGSTITYKEIALKLAKEKGLKSLSAQAVGGAVGHNPISIIIPCHRVVGSNGKLTGYAGGLDKKEYLLKLEQS